ncbi:MAG: response regulator transcription factor [Alphaproteobacteria bacterium]
MVNAQTKTAKRILMVEDDAELRGALLEQLKLHEEYEPVAAESAGQGLARVREDRFDIILLDVNLPDMDGRELCRVMRRQGVKAPIIMLTAADSDSDTILGLEAGANDYITKPFKLNVLLARLRAHLRQHESSEDAVFQIGPYTFKPSGKLLVINSNGKKVRLTEKEAAILKYLYRAEGQIVARDKLLSEVWGYNANVTTHTLETHVYRLRQKIEANPAKSVILVTEGGGYKLVP